MMTRARLLIAPVVLAVVACASAASAQDAMTQAKTLYASADYEQALGLLEKAENSREVHYYRALCLIALGRQDAAEKQMSAVVALDPMFMPGAGEVSPRVSSSFADTRRRMLPQIVRRTFNEGKTLFQAGEREKAVGRFEMTMRMLDDSGIDEDADLADLRLVASGFLDLAKVKAPEVEPAAPAPSPLTSAPSPAAGSAGAAAVTPPAAGGAVASLPVTIEQTLPPWRPDGAAARRTFTGAVRIEIDAGGRVTAAEIQKSVHAAYDQLVLQAARTWRYQPATLNGAPIPSEKTVEIVLQPDRPQEEE